MTRALLVCPEPLDHSRPAGVGIRFLEMERVLREDGHDVTLVTPPLRPERLQQLTASHDVAVVQGHIANDLFAHGRAIPTVVDLYDPFIIENLHYRRAEVFKNDHATLMQSLRRGDFFLCASERQRYFYLGMLLAIGRFDRATFEADPTLSNLIAVAPFGVPPPRAGAPRHSHAVLFGGIYDWYDPILAIEAVAMARQTSPRMTLTFNTHPNPELTPQGKLADAMKHVGKHDYEFVTFEPWVPYEERGAYYDRFALALLTFPQSVETDLSMRTRVFDYLWGGLPIVTSSAPGTDEILDRYGVGRVVHSTDARDFADALLAAGQVDTWRFVEDHQWSRTLAPLREYVGLARATLWDRLKRRIGGSL
jgi:glycosyltransferase involved in cell wall biosynthesis